MPSPIAIRPMPSADQHPGAVRTPAREREAGHDEAEQQQVGERVGEVHRDRHLVAHRGVHDRLEGERAGTRGHGGRRDGPVEPLARAEAHARAEQQHERHVARDVEGPVEGVGHRGNRHGVAVVEDQGPAELAAHPGREAHAHDRPREPLVRAPGSRARCTRWRRSRSDPSRSAPRIPSRIPRGMPYAPRRRPWRGRRAPTAPIRSRPSLGASFTLYSSDVCASS